ncbi:MAG TPA: transglycosylase SLT domain-containing protein [Gemmatimonadaceae bacterium]|nr:transglycosylase SLT domain-containing protein [Gemmatimonadaceae bacterium]
MTAQLFLLALATLSLGCRESSADQRTRAPAQRVVPETLAVRSADPDVRRAAGALRDGRPWLASQTLAPVLADSSRRTPEVELLAASAAAAWEGWSDVQALLTGRPWLDTLAGGRGRLLLARAAFARRDAAAALEHASAAVRAAPGDAERAERTVLVARALDRLEQRDSAAAAYARAADALPLVADWLRLRAAGVMADSAARARLYATVRVPTARARVPWTEAFALERSGDAMGASRALESLGSRAAAFRLRLAGEPDSARREVVRRELIDFIRARAGTADARQAIDVLDAAAPTMTIDEHLVVARSAARSGALERARRGFSINFGARSTPAEQGDLFAYANVLARLNRDREAAQGYARVSEPALLPSAQYQRARALLGAGDGAGARRALQDVVRRFPKDSNAAAARMLLADLATDDGRDADARAAYLAVAKDFPESRHAARARFRAAVIAFAARNQRAAARELDSLAQRYPRSDVLNGAQYWAGRAWADLRDTAKARERWRAVAAREPLSYYAAAAARRLGEESWAPPAPTADSEPASPWAREIVARADLLERLGMDTEAGFEYDALAADSAQRTPDDLLAAGRALLARGQPSRAIAIGWRLVGRGVRDARAYRLAYPVVVREVIAAEAARRSLDPALVAGVIRQESSFNPRATSPAGARGLMQVMPDVGRQLARGRSFPEWDPVLLYQPDVNVQLGVDHLATFVRQYGELARVLAAYNAGPGRVRRWVEKAGADDPELFTERIPFDETRDYVRIVQRNRDLYRALYQW